MSILDCLAAALAAGAVIEVWHKGSIFGQWRARIQAEQDVTEPETARGRLLELATCPFCQSYHIPFYLLLALCIASGLGAVSGSIVRLVLYSLAATRLSNIIDGLLPARMRYVPPLFGDPDERRTDTTATDAAAADD